MNVINFLLFTPVGFVLLAFHIYILVGLFLARRAYKNYYYSWDRFPNEFFNAKKTISFLSSLGMLAALLDVFAFIIYV